jgi:class 3 adenylate cyclase
MAAWDQGDELEELSPTFCAFDDCVYRHGLYKYQHVGSDYIVTCPAIAAPFADEAERQARPSRVSLGDKNTRMAALAAELVRIAEQRQVAVQIGIHCGGCVGAVLGSLRSFYCIIGDTVNVASRLCHAAEPGHIVTSEAFAQTVPRLCVYHMQLVLKGVGPFAVYQIPSNRCPLTRCHAVRAEGDACDVDECSSPAGPADDSPAEVGQGCPPRLAVS